MATIDDIPNPFVLRDQLRMLDRFPPAANTTYFQVVKQSSAENAPLSLGFRDRDMKIIQQMQMQESGAEEAWALPAEETTKTPRSLSQSIAMGIVPRISGRKSRLPSHAQTARRSSSSRYQSTPNVPHPPNRMTLRTAGHLTERNRPRPATTAIGIGSHRTLTLAPQSQLDDHHRLGRSTTRQLLSERARTARSPETAREVVSPASSAGGFFSLRDEEQQDAYIQQITQRDAAQSARNRHRKHVNVNVNVKRETEETQRSDPETLSLEPQAPSLSTRPVREVVIRMERDSLLQSTSDTEGENGMGTTLHSQRLESSSGSRLKMTGEMRAAIEEESSARISIITKIFQQKLVDQEKMFQKLMEEKEVDRQSAIQEGISAAESDIRLWQSKYKEVSERAQSLQEDVDEATNARKEWNRVSAHFQNRISELEEQCIKKEKKLQVLRDRIVAASSAERQNAINQRLVAEMKVETRQAIGRASLWEERLTKVKRELDQTSLLLDNSNTQCQRMQKTLDGMQVTERQLNDRISQLEDKLKRSASRRKAAGLEPVAGAMPSPSAVQGIEAVVPVPVKVSTTEMGIQCNRQLQRQATSIYGGKTAVAAPAPVVAAVSVEGDKKLANAAENAPSTEQPEDDDGAVLALPMIEVEVQTEMPADELAIREKALSREEGYTWLHKMIKVLHFVSSVDENLAVDFTCPVCLEPLTTAVIFAGCGHTTCRLCQAKAENISGYTRCPECEDEGQAPAAKLMTNSLIEVINSRLSFRGTYLRDLERLVGELEASLDVLEPDNEEQVPSTLE
jgi:hypothetical protein